MNTQPTVTILGAGYVGLTTAALLAHAGYKVYAIEPNSERLKIIQSGRSFFFEDGLDILIKTGIESGNFIATDDYSESVSKSSIVFSCVGTPDNPDGSSNLTYVFAAANEAARYMQPGTIYVQKSTVPVGTGKKLQELFLSLNKDFPYVSNPEFLREGTAVYDTLFFDRVVAGGENKAAVQKVLETYKQLETFRDTIAEIAKIEKIERTGKYISTGLNSAELIKVSANAFLALKISFANSIAKLSDAVGADVVEVMDAVGADERIGRAFLNAGRGYGGGCFPKDVSGLISSGLEYGVDLEIMQAAQQVNQSMPGYILEKLKDALDGDLSGKKIAVLGLAFKSGTSDTRKSPGVTIANTLAKNGALVTAYDPQANDEAAHDLDENIVLKSNRLDAIHGVEAVVVATEWPEFANMKPEELTKSNTTRIVVDAVNRLDIDSINSASLQYIGVGR